jgi:UDP-N-acetylmuramyl pentapeptide phosphotransferase/UDP-N-acetylglucosamine-1-phosphate transferase
MAIVGLVDDLLNLSSKIRYGFQLLVSFLIIYTVNFELFVDGKFIQYFPLLILGTAIINCINFMDGIDGLLTGCLLPLLIYAFLTVPSIQLIAAIGSLLAFLKWNWEPSKIFMGDCGSNFLGALTFYLIISNPNLIIDYKVIFIIFPLVIDSSFTIIRRYFNKENIFIAHKKHLYQRLLQTDNNHWKISSFYITICLINFLIILKDSLLILITGILGEVFALLYLDKFIAKKFK